jgi:hypothetical protein
LFSKSHSVRKKDKRLREELERNNKVPDAKISETKKNSGRALKTNLGFMMQNFLFFSFLGDFFSFYPLGPVVVGPRIWP